jgi:TIR domain-containing protein
VSRVFVSSAIHDHAVGDRVCGVLHSLGDEPVDDRDDSRGTAWWNEVVGRIEDCEVFVALVSPAYADAHACRLAVKHAAASGLPVVRLDLGDNPPTAGLHPAVMMARPVRFDPDDPGAPALLDQALNGALFPDQPAASELEEASPASAAPAPAPPPGPPPGSASLRRLSGPELGIALVMVLSALGLQYLLLNFLGGSEPSTTATPELPGVTAPANAGSAPSGEPAPDPGVASTLAEVLARVELVGSPRLPASSCRAGADAVTCSDPAPNIRTVVLTPYQTPAELYAAYTAKVESLSGAPLAENTGNCSEWVSEGEVGWNLDKGHTLDFTVAEQQAGGLDGASESAGRVFCTDSQKVMSLVWTQDPGLLVTVTGQPSELVVTWWSDVHLQLACASENVGRGCA